MDVKWKMFEAFISYGLVPILTATVGGVVWLARKLAAKWDAEADHNKLAAVGTKLTLFVSSVVQDLEATMRPQLGKAAEDGKLTPEEGRYLRDLALTRLKELLAKDGLAEVQDVLGVLTPSLDGFLRKLIESAAGKLPSSAPAGAPMVAASPP